MKKNIKINTLGELETEIMEIIWRLKSASVREVLQHLLKRRRQSAYTTIMTIMSRLAKKGILKRRFNGSGSYIYTPTQDKKTFFATNSRGTIERLIKQFGEVAVAQFIDVVEGSDQKDLVQWQRKLKKIK